MRLSRFLPVLALAFGLGLLTAGSPAFAQKDKEVDLGDFNLKFQVPAGWKVLKTEKKKDSAYVILQEVKAADGAKSKALIGVWIGKKYVADALGVGDVKKGSDLAAAVWAARRAESWVAGSPDKLLPFKADGFDVGFSLNDKSTVTADYKTKTLAFHGVANEKRDGGELTAACASDPDALGRTMKVLEFVIGKEK